MKIMHIADLHIGRTINQHPLLADQSYMLDQLIKEVDHQQIELVIIAGDIYDRTLPSKEAVQLFESFIHQLNIERKLPVLAVSGNHDGASRLGYGKEWFRTHQFYLSTAIEDCFKPVTLKEIDFYLLPYIEPAEAKIYFNDDTIQTHKESYEKIVEEINAQKNSGRKSVIVSHLFIQGGQESDSERPLSMGAVEFVPQSVFKGFDYVALGHLHHPFAIQSDTIFYSGSLLKYSFSEASQPKGYRLVTIDEGVKSIFMPLKPLRDLQVIEGDYAAMIDNHQSIESEHYYQFILHNMRHIKDPMTRLKAVYPNLLELRYAEDSKADKEIKVEVDERSDIEIIEQFAMNMTDEPLTHNQQQIIARLLKEVQHETY
ncbi:exonuclease SbcCD subunit D [Macrococcus hajekii]|uniref:Nuclease SbcCD subunit D n=1 Tax=Macrococcus hajekii TaxID=198482 RepID=A0A4R6BMM3_9STAP|nr:exonuclease SbcCD subunit D [Macrococcus hajekii]TDM03083.1 exonuclease SbcCD subunit D [Macrococcus hajekii]GGB06401.1 nuclease SbcCD subunit D [Macrococcus hajekii]